MRAGTSPDKQSIVGNEYNRLTVVECVGTRPGKHGTYWKSVCVCGNFVICRKDHLTSGNTKSCGCLNLELTGIRSTTHGMSGGRKGKPPEYSAWNSMRQRCGNPRNPQWERYGGRGIKICERWLHSFPAFLEDMGPKPSPRHSIERKDNNSGYSPGNCVWATSREQTRNTRRNHLLTFNGVTLCVADWAERQGLTFNTIKKRLRSGWSLERTLTQPIRRDGKLTLSHRAKIGDALRGGKATPEAIANLRAAWVKRRKEATV